MPFRDMHRPIMPPARPIKDPGAHTPETYPGEARDSALMLLRLGHTRERALDALRRNFPADLNLALAVEEAVRIHHHEIH